MSEDMDRRECLARSWKAGIVVIGAAGAWTSLDLLRPLPSSGLGGVIPTLPATDIPANTTVYVRSAQTYLTNVDGEIVALYQKCPHLGCRVAWCESAGEFECACHGSPRGMDRFTVVSSDDVVEVDTGSIIEGAPAGTAESIDEPRRGEGCSHGSH